MRSWTESGHLCTHIALCSPKVRSPEDATASDSSPHRARPGTCQSGSTCELGGATRLIPGGAGSAPEGGPIVEVMTLYGELRALRGVAPALNARGALAGVSM